MTEIKSVLTPHDLITNDLVNEALKFDLGEKAEVMSWKIKDFTNKGDNYASVVTSIMVKYHENHKINEKSYVAKLNPLRPPSGFTELLQTFYARESIVLREIFDGMNSQLIKLNEPPIKAPKLYARSLEIGKEVIVTENLRTQGFKMYDRTKGMDLKHSLLVMKELGRFHSSSILFEETLHSKTIPEVFDHFEEKWKDVSHPSFQFFNSMMSSQCKSACNFLKIAPSYDKCSKWLTDRMENIALLFIDGFSTTKSMETLCHGDCWTNNMLFSYDEAGDPVDIRFVDLQCSRKGSPAADINYFYYTSLNGDFRKKNMKTMEKIYYDSFLNVFELAGKQPLFTFSEFEIEMINKKQLGLMAGLIASTIVLAEGTDEMMDFGDLREDNFDEFISTQTSNFTKVSEKRDGPFKERFLSMFDEMIEYGIFDK